MTDFESFTTSLPNDPIPESTVDELESKEEIRLIHPSLTKFGEDAVAYDHLGIQLETDETVIIGRFPEKGWIIQDRIEKEDGMDAQEYNEMMEFAVQVYSYTVMDAFDDYPAPESIEGSLVSGSEECPEPGEFSETLDKRQ